MRRNSFTTMLMIALSGAALLTLCACSLLRDDLRGSSGLGDAELRAFAAGIRPKAGDAAYHYPLGVYLQERRKHRPAIAEFKSAVALDPECAKAYNALGVSYDALGEYGSAAEAYTAALAIDPRIAYVLNNLGYSYLMQGKFDSAVEQFRKALALDAANPRYRNNLGLALAKGGRYDEALAAFKQNGDAAAAHANLARLYYEAGHYRESEQHFAKASRLGATDARTGTGLQASAALAKIHGGGEIITPAAPEPREPGRLQYFKVPEPPPAREPESRQPTVALLEMRQVVRRMLEQGPAALPRKIEPLEQRMLSPADHTRSARRTRIELSNGNGVRHLAKNVGDFLRAPDVVPMYLSNAPHFNFQETTIYYCVGYRKEADHIARRLPGRQKLKEVKEIRSGNAEINILIGRDLIPHVGRLLKA